MRIPLLLFACMGLLAGCAGQEEGLPSSGTDEGTMVVPPSGSSSSPDLAPSDGAEGSETLRREGAEGPSTPLRVIFFGTSLTEGLGLSRPQVEAWPARVGELADSAGFDIVVVNAGLSGETSAGALRRVEWVLRQDPDILVIETGANDGLRGIPIAEVEDNLNGILSLVSESSPETRVALVSMEAPTNLGAQYTAGFRQIFRDVASQHGIALTPFLLEGVAGVRSLNQADQIHPTAEGHRLMARNVWTVLDSLLSLPDPR